MQIEVDPIGTFTFAYDGVTARLQQLAYGRVSTTTTPDAYAVTSLYDIADRPTSLNFLDGTSQAFVYDRLDLVRSKDRAGRWTTTSYDALRRQVRMARLVAVAQERGNKSG